MIPPFLKTKLHQITVIIDRAEYIKKMDTFGSVDPYIIVKFGGSSIKTEVVKNNISPTWRTVLKLPLTLPTVNETIQILLMDHDIAKKHEIIGSCYVSIQDILEKKY